MENKLINSLIFFLLKNDEMISKYVFIREKKNRAQIFKETSLYDQLWFLFYYYYSSS